MCLGDSGSAVVPKQEAIVTSEELGQDLEHVEVLQKKFEEFHVRQAREVNSGVLWPGQQSKHIGERWCKIKNPKSRHHKWVTVCSG